MYFGDIGASHSIEGCMLLSRNSSLRHTILFFLQREGGGGGGRGVGGVVSEGGWGAMCEKVLFSHLSAPRPTNAVVVGSIAQIPPSVQGDSVSRAVEYVSTAIVSNPGSYFCSV